MRPRFLHRTYEAQERIAACLLLDVKHWTVAAADDVDLLLAKFAIRRIVVDCSAASRTAALCGVWARLPTRFNRNLNKATLLKVTGAYLLSASKGDTDRHCRKISPAMVDLRYVEVQVVSQVSEDEAYPAPYLAPRYLARARRWIGRLTTQ